MMGDDINKFSRSPRFERSEFSLLSPESRHIYLTFPADSTFREEDVSTYFSIYGPVQDVRIPYQQKRMFGFVTFVYPDTVKLILAKGNPHFVCDAWVLVKPYKEKGKVPDKFRKHQQMERSEFLSCGSPTGLDSRDPFDIQLGARMLYNSQDALWRKKLEEQADLEHAIELQNRRLMELQLVDVKNKHHQAFSSGATIPFPSVARSPNFFQQSIFVPSNRSSPEFLEENGPKNAIITNIQQAANGSDQDRDSPSDELCGSFFSKYTPAIDIWSIGCIFAEMLTGKPLFPGKNVVHQLDLMTDLIGTSPPETIARIRNEKARIYLNSMRKKQPVPFSQKFPNADPLALRLLERLLSFDPKDRLSAEEALADPYFQGLANVEREPSTQPISKLEFEFDRRKVAKDDVRELIYREILEYHPQMLQEYLCGGEQTSFMYPRL